MPGSKLQGELISDQDQLAVRLKTAAIGSKDQATTTIVTKDIAISKILQVVQLVAHMQHKAVMAVRKCPPVPTDQTDMDP